MSRVDGAIGVHGRLLWHAGFAMMAAKPTPIPAAHRHPQASHQSATAYKPLAGETHAVVIADLVNIRSGFGTEYDPIGILKKGDKIKIDGRNLDRSWVAFIYDARRGWISISSELVAVFGTDAGYTVYLVVCGW